MTVYLTVSEKLAIHEDQIQRYGGLQGLRDIALLEAALGRPQSAYYAYLIAEAAAVWESLSQNHPFIDGNKRTAFAVAYTFMIVNGAHWGADRTETESFILDAYASATFKFERLRKWLQGHVRLADTND